MPTMKQRICIAALCVLCISLTACDPSFFSYSYDILSENVIGVELVNYDNPDQKQFFSWVPNHFSSLRPLDLDRLEVLATLEAEHFESFFTQLAELTILLEYYTTDSPAGECIRLLYADGAFAIINHYYAGSYHSDGAVRNFTGKIDDAGGFDALVSDFFSQEVE